MHKLRYWCGFLSLPFVLHPHFFRFTICRCRPQHPEHPETGVPMTWRNQRAIPYRQPDLRLKRLAVIRTMMTSIPLGPLAIGASFNAAASPSFKKALYNGITQTVFHKRLCRSRWLAGHRTVQVFNRLPSMTRRTDESTVSFICSDGSFCRRISSVCSSIPSAWFQATSNSSAIYHSVG
jgi:hypothetical protein